MLKTLKWISFVITGFIVSVFIFAFYISTLLPDTFLVEEGEELQVAGLPFVVPKIKIAHEASASTNIEMGNSYNIDLTLAGFIPVKTVRAQVVSSRIVQVCGTPFGIKMFADGAMVVGYSDIYTQNGYENPAKKAGIEMGDVIQSIGGYETKTNEDVAQAIQKTKGVSTKVVFMREEQLMQTTITAVKDEATNTWRTGMWVRDSSAGMGIMTYIDPYNSYFGGLGHSIHDVDTGQTISLLKGEIVEVEIIGAVAGAVGSPGELKGKFINNIAIGNIMANGETGVYGEINSYVEGIEMEVAFAQEVQIGDAHIYTTVDANGPSMYTVNIEKVALNGQDPNRNMIIEVTDPRLLAKTGGIVQGMSGSPIIQNGKIIGAVTHVFVNDPTRGYGIFIENMLGSAQNIAK